MTSIAQAQDRLNRAVERVEQAAAGFTERNGQAGQDLSEALDLARRENDALRAANADISSRLDAAIERLRTVLGDQA